jgi:hypothetical protein
VWPGAAAYDIPVLIAARLVKPLGNPAANGIKFFATAEVLESAKDRHWLMKVTATINRHWQKKNQGKNRRSLHDFCPSPALPLSMTNHEQSR